MGMLHLYKKEKPSHQLTISIVDSGLGMENPARGGVRAGKVRMAGD